MKTGEVIVKGPFTREEQASWTMLASRRDGMEVEIALLRKMLADEPEAGIRNLIERDIVFETKLRDRIVDAIGIWPNRDPAATALHKRKTRVRLALSGNKGKKIKW